MKCPVIMSGLPGKMASEVAEYLVRSEHFDLVPHALTGSRNALKDVNVVSNSVQLYPPSLRSSFNVSSIGCDNPLVVDYTHPDAVDSNADFYCEKGWSFVMGATDNKRKALVQRVEESQACAVIGPNMAKQVVALQGILERHAQEFPNSLQGYWLKVYESHQEGKADTSQTAKAMVGSFNKLGIPYLQEGIEVTTIEMLDLLSTQQKIGMIRKPELQRVLGVTNKHLKGHGWHEYAFGPGPGVSLQLVDPLARELFSFLKNSSVFEGYSQRNLDYGNFIERVSPDGHVLFKFVYALRDGSARLTHNINGRSIYAQGTLDALSFLERKVASGEKGKVYSMIDVLENK